MREQEPTKIQGTSGIVYETILPPDGEIGAQLGEPVEMEHTDRVYIHYEEA